MPTMVECCRIGDTVAVDLEIDEQSGHGTHIVVVNNSARWVSVMIHVKDHGETFSIKPVVGGNVERWKLTQPIVSNPASIPLSQWIETGLV